MAKKTYHKVNLSMDAADVKRLKRLKRMTGQTYSSITRSALLHEEVRVANIQVREAEKAVSA